jgi:hypothetical protein
MLDNLPDIIGWVGNVFFIYGVYALGLKKVHGFHCNILGNLAYVAQGIMLGIPSLYVLSIGLVLLNIKGIIEWRKG